MKKWLNTLVVASAFIFMGALCSGFHSSEPPMIAYAEGEEAFEEKTYTYVEEGQGEATIVLISETECVMTLVEEGKEPVSYNCTYTLEGNVLTFKYATFSETVVLNNENMTFGEYVEPSQEEDWFKEKWETYVAPMFAGVSLTAIASIAINALIAYFKNKTLDKKIKNMETEALARDTDARNKLAEAQSLIECVKEMYSLIKDSNGLNKSAKDVIENSLKDITKKLDNINTKADYIDKLKQINVVLVNLQIKLAEQSPAILKSGVAEDLNKIKQLVSAM